MFVVRISPHDGSDDYKSFSKLAGAFSRFNQAESQALGGDFSSVALYRVESDNAREAIELVKKKDQSKIVLIKVFPDSRFKEILLEIEEFVSNCIEGEQ